MTHPDYRDLSHEILGFPVVVVAVSAVLVQYNGILRYLTVLNLERSFVALVIITLTSCFAQWTFKQ